MKTAFQGELGSFSDLACRKAFGKSASGVPLKSFKDVFSSVKSGHADRGIIPIENSTAGDIHENYDLLLDYDLHVNKEVYVPVRHCLIGTPNSSLKEIKKVKSHHMALLQCSDFLSSRGFEKQVEYDTAGAVKLLKENGKDGEAAIASSLAAQAYGMKILQEGIENDPSNTTRFFAISKKPSLSGNKTSMALQVPNSTGAIHWFSGAFSKRNISISKLTARPAIKKKWEYSFYLDVLAGAQEPRTKSALKELQEKATMIKIFGSYENDLETD